MNAFDSAIGSSEPTEKASLASGVGSREARAAAGGRRPISMPLALGVMACGLICFEAAYYSAGRSATLGCLIAGWPISLAQLARLATARRAFYAGLATGFLAVAPQLECFWRIFGAAAIPLWLVLAFWIATFAGLSQAMLARLGAKWTALLLPFLWTGLEYFRSELYPLRFAWMNAGYALSGPPFSPLFHWLGVYGVGFVAAAIAGLVLARRALPAMAVGACLLGLPPIAGLFAKAPSDGHAIRIAGVQMEFPAEQELRPMLERLVKLHPEAELLVLSEYTLDGPVPESLKQWCKARGRYLIVGGKLPSTNGNYFNTAFVIGPEGKIVFAQGKRVPIQFFKDGLPAREQALWESPWGKIGICICYDLSYTRVTDRLVELGAQLLVVPTMDTEDWGAREHVLHSLVAPVRAAEYGLPIFRVASSGISQAVERDGRVTAEAPYPGEGRALFATMKLPERGSVPPGRALGPVSLLATVLCLGIGVFKKAPRSEAGDSGKP
jgi:apolipoprotein N-acyltransferase